jgi:hypothetical protein
VLVTVAALVFGIAGVWRLGAARSEPQKRPLCVAMLAFAVGAAFDNEPLYSDLDRFLGIHNFSDLFIHVFGLVGVYFLLRSLDGVIEDTPISSTARWLSPFLLVAVSLSAVLFFATPMHTETSSFTAEYASRPTIVVYWAISIVFPTLCLVQLGQTVLAHRSNPHVALRRGLKIIGVGVVFGFAYATLKLAELITSGAGGHGLASTAHSLDRGLLGVGLLLIGAGFAMSPLATWTKPYREKYWVPRRDRRWVLRSLRRLEWLWRRFCIDAGVIDIIEDAEADLSDDESARFLLLRQVVELRDAQGVLWSYLTSEDIAAADVYVRAWGRVDGSAAARVEARALSVSLERQLQGLTPRREASAPVPARMFVDHFGGPLNLRKEVADLIELSEHVKAYSSS